MPGFQAGRDLVPTSDFQARRNLQRVKQRSVRQGRDLFTDLTGQVLSPIAAPVASAVERAGQGLEHRFVVDKDHPMVRRDEGLRCFVGPEEARRKVPSCEVDRMMCAQARQLLNTFDLHAQSPVQWTARSALVRMAVFLEKPVCGVDLAVLSANRIRIRL